MHISEINIYPIKSLRGISLDSAVVERRGLQYDRRWMLTDARGVFFTQREFPKMANIGVSMGNDGLRVSAAGIGPLDIPFVADTSERLDVTIWQSVCRANVYSVEINRWFCEVLGTDCRLVHMPDGSKRSINPRFDEGGNIVSFADGYPLMLIGEASLADLNSRLAIPLPMNRFRPNLVVVGAGAYAEDNWRRVRIGEAEFRGTKPCERCVITTVDQSKGEFMGKEPLKTLASYRVAKEVMPDRIEKLGVNANAVLFGQNLMAEAEGMSIRVGQRVEVTEY